MSEAAPVWLLVATGSVLTVGALLAFLYTLHVGLRKKIWWPLIVVSSLWLLAMAVYSGWEFDARHEQSRQRIGTPP